MILTLQTPSVDLIMKLLYCFLRSAGEGRKEWEEEEVDSSSIFYQVHFVSFIDIVTQRNFLKCICSSLFSLLCLLFRLIVFFGIVFVVSFCKSFFSVLQSIQILALYKRIFQFRSISFENSCYLMPRIRVVETNVCICFSQLFSNHILL